MILTLPTFAGELGKMTREIWNDIPGTALSAFTDSPRYGQPADSVTTFAGASAPQNIADNFASRVRGYVTAPVTGDYTFWIASDDGSELRISPHRFQVRAHEDRRRLWLGASLRVGCHGFTKIRARSAACRPTLFH